MTVACSPICAQAVAATKRAKDEKAAKTVERKEDAVKREKLKTRSDHMKAAQVAFNAFVRARDMDKPCICCGKPLQTNAVGGGFDCGHYRSVGSAPHLRFHEDNAHGQTKQCNRYGAGRAVDYRIGLIARIGLDAVEVLEADQSMRKYTIDELKEIKSYYRTLTRELTATYQ
jgi:hypothetical protein